MPAVYSEGGVVPRTSTWPFLPYKTLLNVQETKEEIPLDAKYIYSHCTFWNWGNPSGPTEQTVKTWAKLSSIPRPPKAPPLTDGLHSIGDLWESAYVQNHYKIPPKMCLFSYFQSMVTLVNVCSFGDILAKLGKKELGAHLRLLQGHSLKGSTLSLSLGAQNRALAEVS